MSTTLRGGRLDQPEMPTGEIVLQAPPQLEQHEGASGVMMNAIPMLGSLGSIVLVASIGGAAGGGRSYLAAGMFLFATVGFVVVQIDRQRKQRTQQVTGSRTEYLRYLANVRKVAREAADQQRRALTWQHPAPRALPSLAEERSRVWEHHSSDPHFLHVRYGLCAQPLALDLVAPETTVVDQVDPAAASALHRLLVVHRLLPNLPASIDLRAFDRIEVCGPEEEARSLARAMICSAAAFQSPENLEIAVLASEQNLAHWDWMKWLPHSLSTEQTDAVGPMRMVSTSLNDLAALLPPDLSERPRFGADERPATPHLLFVVDGGFLPPGNHVVPSRRPARRHRARPAVALGRAGRRVVPAAAVRARPAGGGGPLPAERAAAARGAGARAGRPVRPGDGRGVRPPADPAAHRDRGRHRHRRAARSPGRWTSWTCSASARCTASTPRSRGASGPPATGCACPSGSATAAT